ncbi:MAG: hypothetical protein RLZZ67_247 [Candidatus Parcubacteria bacterium]
MALFSTFSIYNAKPFLSERFWPPALPHGYDKGCGGLFQVHGHDGDRTRTPQMVRLRV